MKLKRIASLLITLALMMTFIPAAVATTACVLTPEKQCDNAEGAPCDEGDCGEPDCDYTPEVTCTSPCPNNEITCPNYVAPSFTVTFTRHSTVTGGTAAVPSAETGAAGNITLPAKPEDWTGAAGSTFAWWGGTTSYAPGATFNRTATVALEGRFTTATLTTLGAQTINLSAPVAGAAAQTSITGGTGFTGTVSWTNMTDSNTHVGTFASGKVYRANVTLVSVTGYQWPAAAPIITVTGQTVAGTAVAGTGAGNTLTFTVTFAVTVATSDQTVANAIYTWITWNLIRGNNASGQTNNRHSVTGNLNLPDLPSHLDGNGNQVSSSASGALATSGFSVDWTLADWSTAAHGAAISLSGSNRGAVTLPTGGNSVNVTLRARVRRPSTGTDFDFSGSITHKTFPLTLSQPSADQEAIGAAMNWLIWTEIRRFNETTLTLGRYPVYSNLTLPATYKFKPNTPDEKTVDITWASNNTARVSAAGNVDPAGTATDVTITATFRCGSITTASNTKEFPLRVGQPTNSEAVAVAVKALVWDTIKNQNTLSTAVFSNLHLPTTGECGTTVSWASSNVSIISSTGVVTPPPQGGVGVTLTATVSRSTAGQGAAATGTTSITVTVGDPVFQISVTGTGFSATMPAAQFNILTANGTKGVEVVSAVCNISFDAVAARAIGQGAAGDIVITAAAVPFTSLNAIQAAAVGTRPIYELKVSAGALPVTGFGGGTATVSIPYTLLGEDQNAIVIYHLNEITNTLEVVRSYYSAGRAVFATGHFSKFVIGHNLVTDTFVDISQINAVWNGEGRQHITFVTSRGLYNGNALSDGRRSFGPNDTMTRAQFVAVLRNYDGANLANHITTRFADATDCWDYRVVAWGESAGIFGTYSDVNFRPNDPISRADMAYWLYNYAVRNGIVLEAIRTLDFLDISHLPFDYSTAVRLLANAGVLSGDGAGTVRNYHPDALSTRAEVAAIVAQFVKAFR
jgi:hypothetical protein